MKSLLAVFLVTIGLTSSIQGFTQDTIYWSPCYQLKYEDFKGRPDSTNPQLANSYIRLNYTYDIQAGQLRFKVSCFFLKNISWTKYDLPTLMEHEQGHFDIAELFALKLEQRFTAYKITNNVQQDLSAIYERTLRELYAMSDQYDARIKGAMNDTPQKEFIASVRKQIPICKKKR